MIVNQSRFVIPAETGRRDPLPVPAGMDDAKEFIK